VSLNIADFQSRGDDVTRPAVEIRSPKTSEAYYVLDGMVADNVNVSRLGTSRDFLIGPGQLKLIHPDDRRGMNLQAVGLRNGLLLCVFDPKRSKLGNAFEQAKGKWAKHEFVHKDRAYHVWDAEEQGPPPEPRFASLGELIESEFADRIVDRDDHPVLRDYVAKREGGK
jgi:hypothetical protein